LYCDSALSRHPRSSCHSFTEEIYSERTKEEIDRFKLSLVARLEHWHLYQATAGDEGEEEHLAAIAKLPDEEQDLVGIVLYGKNKQVDKAVDGLKFHP
jgi:hypothetical protein